MVFRRLRQRNEWKFFGVLPKADPTLAVAWWSVLVLRGMLPAGFAIAMGVLVGAFQRGDSLAGPLTWAGVVFVLLQVLTPVSYTHLRAHEPPEHLVCRLLLEKKKKKEQ